jgi:hypothetical protein
MRLGLPGRPTEQGQVVRGQAQRRRGHVFLKVAYVASAGDGEHVRRLMQGPRQFGPGRGSRRAAARRCHWQLVNRETLVKTSAGGWKLLVPEGQVLDASAREPLQQAAEGHPYELGLRQLRLA